jgi:hypothetical protein
LLRSRVLLFIARFSIADHPRNNDMTRWHIDNLMTHVCAAALLVDNFEVDVNDLRDDLKLENKE